MTWEELLQKINDYNNTATICFNKNTLNIKTLKFLGNSPEESYRRIVSILVGEYITHEYIPQYARWEDNPIRVIVETKFLNEFHDYVEYVLDSLDNDYDKILKIIKNKEQIRNMVGIIGAIVGDLIGQTYEFHSTKDYNFQLLTDKSHVTDDSTCTIAVADCLLHTNRTHDELVNQLCSDGYIPNEFIDIINEFHEKYEL